MAKVPLPAVALSTNCVKPPFAKLAMPPLLVKVPPSALDVLRKFVWPTPPLLTAVPLLMKLPLPAIALPLNSVEPPSAVSVEALLVKAPLPALEVLSNCVLPPGAPKSVAALLVKVPLPAVALLVKVIIPRLPLPSTAVTNFSVIPELFVMPTPLMVKKNVGLKGGTVIVNGLAPALNTMPFTSVKAEMETLVILEVANVPVSAEPLGTMPAVQLAAVFQSPLTGLAFHVFTAKAVLRSESKSKVTVARKKMCVVFFGKLRLVFISLILYWARRLQKTPGAWMLGKARAPSQVLNLQCALRGV